MNVRSDGAPILYHVVLKEETKPMPSSLLTAAAIERAVAIRRSIGLNEVPTAAELVSLEASCRAAGATRSRIVREKLASIRTWHTGLCDTAAVRRLGGPAVVRARLSREIDTLVLRLNAESAPWRAGLRRRRLTTPHPS